MCGRYLFTEKEDREIKDILREIDRKYGENAVNPGEIYPTNAAPVLVGERGALIPELYTWGFPNFKNKGVVINARAESVSEKPMFQKSLAERRCIVVTTGFYEWDKDKRKYLFTLPESGALYLAGLYGEFSGEKRFTILTTAANASVLGIHSRMPLVLMKADLQGWAFEPLSAMEMLKREPPMLQRSIA